MSGRRARARGWAAARLLAAAAVLGLSALGVPALADTYRLSIEEVTVERGGVTKTAIGYNGQSPGPTLRFREGEEVVIEVTNRLPVTSSIHWHGLILPSGMDGVPGLSYDGISPGETFTYRSPEAAFEANLGAADADPRSRAIARWLSNLDAPPARNAPAPAAAP